MSINVHIHPSGEKTAELTCNWCREPHKVEPGYREEMLARGARELAKVNEQLNITPEETWTCGRCMLVLCGHPVDAFRTNCHEHEVPKERKQ